MKFRTINYKFSILIIFTILVYSCKRESNNLSEKSSIWEEFKIGIEKKDYKYLIDNSFDSIKCIDCVPNKSEIPQLSENIFKNYPIEFYDGNLLNEKEYSVFKNDTIIRINYSFENKFGEESYNIIYMFDKKDDTFLLRGRITVP